MSDTRIDEIADGVYRLSTWIPDVVPPLGLTFNQFLLEADEPLLFHTGPRALFPLVTAAVARVRPVEELRWIAFGHVEADECGSMNDLLAIAPHAEVAHGALGCDVSLNDLCDRAPRALADGEVIDLGGKRVRHLDTPHVPHNWEARVLYEETTGTLLCGDLFSHLGDRPPVVEDDVVERAMQLEAIFPYSSRSPALPATLERLADLRPAALAIMHGSTYRGDGSAALRSLAAAYAAQSEPR